MEYIDFSAGMGTAEHAGERSAQSHFDHYAQQTASALSDQQPNGYYVPNAPPGLSCDVKPRLTKEQHDILEAHYQKQPKPNTNTKRGFAESLGVSLEKVNNWFQNRRAKSKQDAKKAAGSVNLYPSHQQNLNSESESSPFDPSSQYSAMMQQWSAEGQTTNGLGISQMQQQQAISRPQDQSLSSDATNADQFQDFSWASQLPQETFETPLEMNRRTLTQEGFDAIQRNGGMYNGYEQLQDFQNGFSGNQEIMNSIFPDMSGQEFKDQDLTFPYPAGAPLSRQESNVASSLSEQSHQFPSSNMMQDQANISASNSEWADSRSSSLSVQQHDSTPAPMSSNMRQGPVATGDWQPGQSVPVDIGHMREHFRQAAAQSRSDSKSHEQPLAYPSDEEAFSRRGSQASALTHSMSSFGLNTPQTNQPGVFKSPMPASSLAARRQRPRPAALGSAALRSQSYSGAGQQVSPGDGSQQMQSPHEQHLRRIRSAVAMNGGLPQGRIMKSTPGSAQRSPLNWNFNDALNSPNAVRHVSQGTLAPPTPMSPREFPRMDAQSRQASGWQNLNQFGRQPSINEADADSGMPFLPSASLPAQNFTSPPHTPMYYDHSFMAQRVGQNTIIENTPPQSAPAGQSCFPSNLFATGNQPVLQQPSYQQLSLQQSMHAAMSQPHQFTNMSSPEQQSHMPNVTFAPNQQANVTTGPPPGMPLQFANGVPVLSAEGNFKMSFPPQAELMQQQSQQMQSPSSQQGALGPNSSPNLQGNSLLSGQSKSELMVHEYNPPDAVKRAATPRKTVDTGPKNYTFTHARPEHFQEKKNRKSETRDSASISSPASSGGTFSST